MDTLSAGYQMLSNRIDILTKKLNELMTKVDGGKQPERSVSVGFDDVQLERTAIVNNELRAALREYAYAVEEPYILKKLERFKLHLRNEYLVPNETMPPVIDEAIREIKRLRSRAGEV